MKHLFLIIFILSTFGLNISLNAQCDIQGQNCYPTWQSGGYMIIDRLGCEVWVYYDYIVCDGITYFRLDHISYEDTEDCDAYEALVLPNGVGSTANQVELWNTWKIAFNQIYYSWFMARHQANPNQYNCPNKYIYRTIGPGGCTSWRYASKTVSPNLELRKFIPVSCEENGCCIHEVKVCWDTQTNQPDNSETSTTMVSQGDCEELEPLFNPFEGYGSEWYIGPASTCEPSCYIWD